MNLNKTYALYHMVRKFDGGDLAMIPDVESGCSEEIFEQASADLEENVRTQLCNVDVDGVEFDVLLSLLIDN